VEETTGSPVMPAMRILPEVVIGLMMAPVVWETDETVEPEREEPFTTLRAATKAPSTRSTWSGVSSSEPFSCSMLTIFEKRTTFMCWLTMTREISSLVLSTRSPATISVVGTRSAEAPVFSPKQSEKAMPGVARASLILHTVVSREKQGAAGQVIFMDIPYISVHLPSSNSPIPVPSITSEPLQSSDM